MEKHIAYYLRLAEEKKKPKVEELFNLGKTKLDWGNRFVGTKRARLTKRAYDMRDMSYYEDISVPEEFTLAARSNFDKLVANYLEESESTADPTNTVIREPVNEF